jgi:CHAT domain-containing protein
VESAVSKLDLSLDAAAAEALFSTLVSRLIRPLPLPAGISQVLVSPEPALLEVPFPALLPEKDVATVPSATVYLRLAAERALAGSGVLAVGDPDVSVAAGWFPRLPYARREVESIGTKVLVGTSATERAFRDLATSGARWRGVHVAVHSPGDSTHPLLAALVLCGDDVEDGYMTALEISQLRIAADLVSLSSCDTGRNAILQGGGIGSLPRAFLYAGTSRVLVSTSKVNDEATAAFMTKFYELWNPADESKRIGAARALREAQAHLRRKGSHPRDWAPWTLWGLPD